MPLQVAVLALYIRWRGGTGTFMDFGCPKPRSERRVMDPVVAGDVLDTHVRTALACGTHDVFAKLFGVGLGHCDILSAGTWPSDQQVLQIRASASTPCGPGTLDAQPSDS